MKNYFIEEMLNIVDLDRKISHEKLAEKTEDTLMDDKNYKKLKFPADVCIPGSDITEICNPWRKASAISNDSIALLF
jgi:hypothetical protein